MMRKHRNIKVTARVCSKDLSLLSKIQKYPFIFLHEKKKHLMSIKSSSIWKNNTARQVLVLRKSQLIWIVLYLFHIHVNPNLNKYYYNSIKSNNYYLIIERVVRVYRPPNSWSHLHFWHSYRPFLSSTTPRIKAYKIWRV